MKMFKCDWCWEAKSWRYYQIRIEKIYEAYATQKDESGSAIPSWYKPNDGAHERGRQLEICNNCFRRHNERA